MTPGPFPIFWVGPGDKARFFLEFCAESKIMCGNVKAIKAVSSILTLESESGVHTRPPRCTAGCSLNYVHVHTLSNR